MLSAIYLGISGGRRKEKTVFLIAVSISILGLFYLCYFPCLLILQHLVRFSWAIPNCSTFSCSHFISHFVWFKVFYLLNILL